MEPITLTFLSVLGISALSLVGAFTIRLNSNTLSRIISLLVSISVGALLANSFLHLLPEASERLGASEAALWLLGGMLMFFILEKYLHWHHSHHAHAITPDPCVDCEQPHHPVGALVIIADALHNILDGAIIATGFLVSTEVGIATTVAVALHELPQEMGDFGVLVHAGFSRTRALLANFASGLAALIGAALVFGFSSLFDSLAPILSALAAGSFIYIAMVDLVPELHKTSRIKESLAQFCFVLIGVGLIVLFTPTEHAHEPIHEENTEAHTSEEIAHATEKTTLKLLPPTAIAKGAASENGVTEARVVRIIDGDTLVVHTSAGEETVRLIGIDAPEKRLTGGGKECYSQEATDALTRFAPPGSTISLEPDTTQDARDRYERILAYIIDSKGNMVNQKLIAEGYAQEYTYQTPYKHQETFVAAEEHAQMAQVGIWHVCLPLPN